MQYTSAVLKKPKSGDWYVYYSYRNPATGKLSPFKLRGDLNRIKDKKQKEHEGAIMVDETNQMLREGWSPFDQAEVNAFTGKSLVQVLNELYEIKKPGLRPRSVQHYKHAVDLITDYLAGSPVKPQHFTPAMAQGYSDYLMVKRGYTPGTHNNQLSNANIFFNAMIERDVITKNPFSKVRNKPVSEGKLLWYSKEQKEKIRDYTKRKAHPMYMFIQWIYYCFVRPNELMQLQIKHIDFSTGILHIPSYASKNRKSGVVAIPEQFIDVVRTKYEGLDPEFFIMGYGLKPHPTQVHRNRASQSHKEMLKKVKISNDHILYDWKNTGARDFILAGHNPYELMHRMRHHSLDQTMVYLRSLGVTTGMKTDPKAWNF